MHNCEMCGEANTQYDGCDVYSTNNCSCWICYDCVDEDDILRQYDETVDYIDDDGNDILRTACPACNVRKEKRMKIINDKLEEEKKIEKEIRRKEEIKLYLYYLHLGKKISKKAFIKLLDMCCDAVY